MTNFTPEQLISYHYGELDAELAQEIEQALATSWPLREKYRVIKEATERLDSYLQHPRPQVVDRILEYGYKPQHVAELEN